MKNIILVLLLCFSALGFGQGPGNKIVKAGFSQIGITPGTPIIMSGYGGRDDPFKGIHDSIYAQAMYLKQGDKELLLITSDLIGHSRANVEMLSGMLMKETGIPAEGIFITAAHNHGGPVNGTYMSEDRLPQDVKNYIDELYHKLLIVAVRAKAEAQPVEIGFKKGESHVNINRRAVYSEGEIWLGRNQEGACDHDVDIIKFTDLQGKLLAVHVNYPCHGTCTGQENYLITGDWPGITAHQMKEKLGKRVVVMVTAGASANINPLYGPNDNFREVEAVAYGVSSVALGLLDECKTSVPGSLNSAIRTVEFPGKKRWDSPSIQESVPADDVQVHFSAFRMGTIVMAGISGELFTEIGMNVKRRAGGQTSIITHCNGASGYICTDASYTEGGYEPQVTHLMPGSEQQIENIMLELIESLQETKKASP